MNAIQFDSRFTDRHGRERIRQETDGLPLPSAGVAPAEQRLDAAGSRRYSTALAVFKGGLIVAAVVFVTITLALQAAARFS